jgi:AcrR family transcriptional regulator
LVNKELPVGIRAQQREETKRSLVQEGRRLFAERGYGAVGLAEIANTAGVTKGALYHHFDSKAALFRAVLEQVQQEVADKVAAAADAESDPWAQLTAGCRQFLTASTDPDVQRIMLVDGPAVLGWAEWRAMDEATSAHHLAEALTALVAADVITKQPVAPLTHLLSGAMNEAALWLASSSDPDDLADTWSALSRMLESLRTSS